MTSRSAFSTSRYIGNKSKQLQTIQSCLFDYGIRDAQRVVDVFSGTGCVSHMFLNTFPSITEMWANDIEPYAYIYTKARLWCHESREHVEKRIASMLQRTPPQLFFPRTIATHYANDDPRRPSLFTREHAVCIDTYAALLHKKPISKIDAPVMAAVLDEVMRKNFGYGHFHNAIRQDEKRRKLAWTHTPFRPVCVTPMGKRKDTPVKIHVSAKDALGFLSRFCPQKHDKLPPIDVVFIDPPYSSYNYGRMYHVLNTIVLHDNPETNGMHAVRRDYHRSPFSQKSRAHAAFQALFSMCSACTKYVCISYCTHGVVSVSDILEWLKQNHFVQTKTYTLSQRKSMQKNTLTEILIISQNMRMP